MASKNMSSSSSSSVGRTSIHTPLKPASVQDLKAKFDPGTAVELSSTSSSSTTDATTAVTTNSSKSKKTSYSPRSERTGGDNMSSTSRISSSISSSSATAPPLLSSSSSQRSSSSAVTLSSISSSLHGAAERKLALASGTGTSLASTAKVGSGNSSSVLALTTPRPFSASSTACKTSSINSSSTTTSNKWEPKSAVKSSWTTSTTTSAGSNTRKDTSPSNFKSSFSKDKEGRLELPVMHIVSTDSDVQVKMAGPKKKEEADNKLRTAGVGDHRSRYLGKKVSETKRSFGLEDNAGVGDAKTNSKCGNTAGGSKDASPPVQRTNRLVAREIKIERLDTGENVTSYKDTKTSEFTTKSGSSPKSRSAKESTDAAIVANVGNKVREIKVQRIPSETALGSSAESGGSGGRRSPEFRQVKLRPTKLAQQQQGSSGSGSATTAGTAAGLRKATATDDGVDKRKSRKISPERFERLKFDFERGVPTETIARRESETSDHIALQLKARELSKPVSETDTPIIAKKKKEESILTEGLKVSDFVKQVNKMNPDQEGPPKWKLQKQRSQASSAASSDVGGDSYYQGIPGEDMDPGRGDQDDDDFDDDEDIYEKVIHRAIPSSEVAGGVGPGDADGESSKAPGRRLGVYSQMKILKNYAFKKLKQKENKKKGTKGVGATTGNLSDSEEIVIHSDGEGGWENTSDVSSEGTDYEDVGPDDPGGECVYEDLDNFSQAAKDAKKKTLTHKLKNIFGNKKVKNKKGRSAGEPDSDGDFIEDAEDVDSDSTNDNLSRTSSERSRNRPLRTDDVTTTTPSSSTATTATTTATTSTAAAAEETAAVSTVAYPTTTDNTIITTSSTGDYNNCGPPQSRAPSAMASSSSSSSSSSNVPPPPPTLPPRTSKVLSQAPVENSPPLPPRNPSLSNKATLGIPLDTVVPISPRGGSLDTKKKDRFSFGQSSQDSTESSHSSTGKLEYIDYDPASPLTLERIEKADRKSAGGSRPTSSASTGSTASSYIYPDISAFPELKAYNHDDNLYVDLEDEHIYGKASDMYVSQFQSEPLYQWYSKDKMIQNIRSDKSDDLSDEEYLELEKHSDDQSIYEDVERLLENSSTTTTTKTTKTANTTSTSNSKPTQTKEQPGEISGRDKPQRRSIIEDVFKNGGTLHRALWCQMPEVIESGVLKTISDKEKKLQEAMFEIMTSEASYSKSLKILINVFLMAPEFSADMSDRCIITRRDRQVLFSNVGHIKDISESFLKDLEMRWQESYYLSDVCDIIHKHASKKFEPYVRYCSNQLFQDRAFNSLKTNPEFTEAVKRLEQHPDCQFLPLSSFLLLPMQRITRLPLLVDAICHRLDPGTPRHASAQKALDSLRKVAKRCDEAAKKMQQTEQICLLASNLEFKIKEVPLVSSSRFLVKQGELTLIKGDGTTRKPLSKLLGSNKENIYLFLFNDMLLLTKKKGSIYQVRDYCQRNSLHVEAIDNPDKSRHIAPGTAQGVHNIMFLAMLANHDNKQVELVLSSKSESERTRWIDAIMPVSTSSDNERIYDYWDCPQYQCVRKYLAQEPDELTLEESDVVNVTRKMSDGWYEGERIRDGEKGWFPASHTEEINNSHVRARNLRLRYRLLIASQDYAQTELVRP